MTSSEQNRKDTWRSYIWGFTEDRDSDRNFFVGFFYLCTWPISVPLALYFLITKLIPKYKLSNYFDFLPGIDPVNKRRRNVIIGGAYTFGGTFTGLASLGAILPEPEQQPSNGKPEQQSSNEANCAEVVSLGGYTRDSEIFEVEEGQYISITIENNAGFRTRGVLNYGNEVPFGESVEGVSNKESWRVFDPDHPDQIIEERTGEWVARYEPTDSEPSTSGSVSVEVCWPAED